ncbi:hypothetical protein PHLCEN_2v8679 [Hermanssonia centrifuga]|uniref:Uncharacterized protein n=1 Tax=Hermanssonia centrifuga TaxID=98765 RepID=A0A2R6NSY2_9APHY|nr:hypothetical protein PHLCEN_2v8679 [Hermanssonia centrifuga]
MIQLLRIWHNNYNLRYVSTTHVQFVFSAGTVFVLSAIQAISGPRLGRVTLATSLSQTEKCIEFLSIIGGSWETAVCAKEILLNFFDETLKPRLLLRGGEASLMQFDMPSTAASQVAGAERMGDPRARTSSSATAASVTSVSKEERQDESPSFSLSTLAIPVPLSPTLPTPCSPINDLRYFPSNPPAPNLGWPMMHSVESSPVGSIGNVGAGVGVSPKSSLQYHMTLPSPTIDHYISHSSSHSHSNSQGGGDMDLDVGYVLGMDMNIISDIPAVNHGRATNRQVHAHSQGTAADMMSFGVPELGVGYQFDPHTHSHIALDFSEEELAIMDQIVRQQQHQHQHQHHHPHQHQQHGGTGLDMMYPTGVSLA